MVRTKLPAGALTVWRRLIAGVILGAPALLVVACSAGVPDTPTPPTSQPSLTTSPGPETTSAAPPSDECMGRLGAGSLRMTGGPVRTVIINGDASFSCGAGPLVNVEKVTDTEVAFTASGSPVAPVTITNGSSAAVGPYEITLLSIDADTAVFKVVAPS